MKRKKRRYKPRFFFILFLFLLLVASAVLAAVKPGISTAPVNQQPKNSAGEEASSSVAQAAAELSEAKEEPRSEEPEKPNTTTPESAYPLSAADDDILVLVNKTHPVTEGYKPEDLVAVESCDTDIGNPKTRSLRKAAADAFEELAAASRQAGYNIIMRTGYRSYSYQANLYNSYVQNHGEEKANTYSAKPGQSEHQTGLCCDVGVRGRGLSGFNGTEEAQWIAENSWKYGFILRYPENKTNITGYIYESWHIRYVGREAAELIYGSGLTLEEYLERTD